MIRSTAVRIGRLLPLYVFVLLVGLMMGVGGALLGRGFYMEASVLLNVALILALVASALRSYVHARTVDLVPISELVAEASTDLGAKGKETRTSDEETMKLLDVVVSGNVLEAPEKKLQSVQGLGPVGNVTLTRFLMGRWTIYMRMRSGDIVLGKAGMQKPSFTIPQRAAARFSKSAGRPKTH